MIIINAKFTIKEAKRAEFLDEATQLIEATRKEDGCLSYQLYESTEQVNVFLMVENWRDEQAIEGHNQSPLLQQLFKNMPEYAEKETELNVAKTLA
ncbi:putative quinol monooxygenase [Enterococcus spodopteracolus]|uniref:putative quinol monooxygenase n=1 Tax=Enterococcus spodopteracolus TaxID=3034501 RepID=UPI0026487CCF|nr:putative quinol monooxygenase [Enterococcus spodopteracolus]